MKSTLLFSLAIAAGSSAYGATPPAGATKPATHPTVTAAESPVPAPAPISVAPAPGNVPAPESHANVKVHLTLTEAIDRGIREATLAIKTRNGLEFSGEQLLQGYAQFLPDLRVGGTFGYQQGHSYLTTATPSHVYTRNEGASYQVASTLNLFNGFADFSAWKASRQRKDAAELSVERARQQITLDVTQSFLQVLLDQDVVRIAEKSLALSRQREALLTEKNRLGSGSTADLFRQQAETSAAESQLSTVATRARNDLLQLAERLRLDTSHDYVLERPAEMPASFDTSFADENQLVAEALQRRPDLKESEASLEAARWDVTTARAPYMPRLDVDFSWASAGRNLYQQDVDGLGRVPAAQAGLLDQLGRESNYTIGLTLSWRLFDRGNTRLSVARARLARENAEVDHDDERLTVETGVRQAAGDYRTAFNLLSSSRKGLEAAQKAYEVIDGRYEVGSASFIDLIAAQTALIQAESARAQAVFGFRLATDQVRYATGRL